MFYFVLAGTAFCAVLGWYGRFVIRRIAAFRILWTLDHQGGSLTFPQIIEAATAASETSPLGPRILRWIPESTLLVALALIRQGRLIEEEPAQEAPRFHITMKGQRALKDIDAFFSAINSAD